MAWRSGSMLLLLAPCKYGTAGALGSCGPRPGCVMTPQVVFPIQNPGGAMGEACACHFLSSYPECLSLTCVCLSAWVSG